MNFIELQEDLQNLTKQKIFLAELARILGCGKANISKRAQNNSEVTVTELQLIERYYGVSVYKSSANTGERQNDTTVKERVSHFGERLGDLQDQHEYLDKDMAKLLKISEEDYIDLKLGDTEPDLAILNRLKQCFKVSIDYLLYGE